MATRAYGADAVRDDGYDDVRGMGWIAFAGVLLGLAGIWNLIDPQVDQQTDTLIMRATIANPDRRLIDGQFVTATIRERQEEPRLVVPQAAVQIDQSGSYVLVVDDQHKVEQRRIRTGENQDTDIVVSSGLREGDNVVVDGIQKVRPGQVVEETKLAPAGG